MMKYRILALYVLMFALTGYSMWRSEQANDRADRANARVAMVDHRGDIRACVQENRIREEANARNHSLKQTALYVKAALLVLSKAGDPNTNAQLRAIAKKADKVEQNFKPTKKSDCSKVFPRPK